MSGEPCITVSANRGTCEGYGNCVRAAPAVFDLDDEGLVVLKEQQVRGDQLPRVRQARYDCPTDSISFEQRS